MHIDKLKIADSRNLKDFEIAFTSSAETADGEFREFKSHAIIGRNGSGKSNFMEAIITIFRDLDLNNAASFDYEMEYGIREHQVKLVAVAGKKPAVVIDGERSSATALAKHAKKYLPSHVFTYYSGKNERIEQLFQAHQKRFTQALRKNKDDLIRRFFIAEVAIASWCCLPACSPRMRCSLNCSTI